LARSADYDVGGAEYGLGGVEPIDPHSVRPATEPAFFEIPAHETDVINGIVTGHLPLKYAYAGSAAHTHDKLARSSGYRSVIGSHSHEMWALGRYLPYAKLPSSVVEIGPGNGAHSVALLSNLLHAGAPLRRYLGLDFSDTLVTLSRGRIANSLGDCLVVDSGRWDVEAAPSTVIDEWRTDAEAVLIGLFGQTIGNVEDPIKTFTHIYDSSSPGDVLVVTVALLGKDAGPDEVLAPYRTEVFRDAVVEPLRAARIAAEDMELRLNFVDGTVIGDVVLRSPVIVGGHPLAVGHRVRCFRSRRFTAAQVRDLFDRSNWSVEHMAINVQNDHAVIIGRHKNGGQNG
jgi:L-histidine N-alpha-methyltransferase